MSHPARYLGVDVSKETLVVALTNHRWKFPNTDAGHRKLIKLVKRQTDPVQVICEATGPYHLPMCLSLQSAGVPVTIANPARIHYFGLSEGVIAKNDPIDAGLIASFGESKQPPADPPLSPEQLAVSELLNLLNLRNLLVESAKGQRVYRQQVLSAESIREIDKTLAALERRIEDLERKLRQKMEANPLWKSRLERLMSVNGVGFLTALVLVIKMPELGALKRGQCAALAGLAPFADDSGTQGNKRCIKGGRAEVRKALYMAALSAVRHNPILKAVYQHLRKMNKAPKVALTAVMRKLLIYLNALLKAHPEASSA